MRPGFPLAALASLLVMTSACGNDHHFVSLVVRPASETLTVGNKNTFQFTAVGTLDNGVQQDIPEPATWTSSEPAIAIVDNFGRAACVAPGGPVTITATTPVSANSSATVSGSSALTCVP